MKLVGYCALVALLVFFVYATVTEGGGWLHTIAGVILFCVCWSWSRLPEPVLERKTDETSDS
jgi:hypothetical protein